MRMFDMNTKSKLFQDSPLSFDDLGFQAYVVLIQYHRTDRSEKKKVIHKNITQLQLKTTIKVSYWLDNSEFAKKK